MDAARAGQAAYRDRFPTDKPPLVDGDLFSSLFEGATGGEAGEVTMAGNEARVQWNATNDGAGFGGKAVRWSDVFVLRRSGGSWRIADVEYGGGWDFAPRGHLADALREVAALRGPR